jgi:GntR family transcriptional regulator, rspAB operon transcriptional repressor
MNPLIPPIKRSSTLRERLYGMIRELIVSGALRPGETVNEVAIAQSLGVSRTPVREAVKRLFDEGLISVLAQSGTYVTPINVRDIEEAYVIRKALEDVSVSRAAARISRDQVEELEANIVNHETAIQRNRVNDAIRLDDAFHRMIAEVNGLHMLWRAVDISKAQMDRGRYLAIPTKGNGERTITEHRQILAALARHDVGAASTAMRDHLSHSVQSTIKAVLEAAE